MSSRFGKHLGRKNRFQHYSRIAVFPRSFYIFRQPERFLTPGVKDNSLIITPPYFKTEFPFDTLSMEACHIIEAYLITEHNINGNIK